ncbi:MAG TPA: AIR synthase-related protein [Candidatus Polarisedimenticolaceae bacterium]|nr:AIR synthase-related protein [Candidatus Polarisedimenticolaceae bacterium]
MVTRMEIGTLPGRRDVRGETVAAQVREFLRVPLQRVRTRDILRLDGTLRQGEAERLLLEFVDPVLQSGAIGRLDDGPFDVAVTVGLRPGVADPVGKSARVAVEDTLGRRLEEEAAVYTATLYLFDGVTTDAAERIALELLANPVIHTVKVESRESWAASGPDLEVPRVAGHGRPAVQRIDLSGDDAALSRLSRERLLALTLPEMHAIRDHFAGRAPTDVELECLAQTWSEHCKHKIFAADIVYEEPGRPVERISSLFSTFIRGATRAVDEAVRAREGASWLVSVFHDNAGVVAFDALHHLVFKVETHNSPSALDPYGGAITGIVGVNRDPFATGMGADLLCNVWGYCFAPPAYTGPLPPGLLHPRRIRAGVHRGVIDGGNQSGVPYARGFELFDARFLGKPLVFCGTVGALPVTVAGKPAHEKAALPGDAIVMTGGRIGADGIHGATFSSAALTEAAPVQAVQIGDPLTQKMMFDFLVEARDRGLYRAITDNGAGGLSSSVGEMARAPGGARLDLARAPLKYAGLAPWEVFLSEAQERMTLAVPPESVEAFLELARGRDVEATVLGTFTDGGRLEVFWGDELVGSLSMDFLHEGVPKLTIPARWVPPTFPSPAGPTPRDLGPALLGMLARLNLCSDEETARAYDHEVKGLTVVKPWVGVRADVAAEGTVLLVRHGTQRGYVLSEGVHPFLSDLDAHAMARWCVDLAVRKQLCAGARLDRIALLDNFCWPDPVLSEGTPDGPFKAAQLVRACRGLYEACVAYGAPLISGKDSMKNDAVLGGVKISVPPTLLVSALGLIDDVQEALTLDFKAAGDSVFVLGTVRGALGGSEYLRWRGAEDGLAATPGAPAPYVGSDAPQLRTEETLPLYAAFREAVRQGLVRAAAAPALGGLAPALARCAMGGELGLEADLASLGSVPPDALLFAENTGVLVAEVAEVDRTRFQALFAGLPCVEIGRVTARPHLVLRSGANVLARAEVASMKGAWKGTLAHA